MQLYFIRHGQSQNNKLYAETGSNEGRYSDPDLTVIGRQQAQHVAEFLCRSRPEEPILGVDLQNVRGFNITHLYTSLMLRAVATGSIISRTLKLPLLGWKDLHETGGMFLVDPATEEKIGQPGKTSTYFTTHYPELVLPEDVTEAGWWNRPFEEQSERPIRAQRVLAELLVRHGNTSDRVAIVSHGGFFTHLICAILALPFEQQIWFYMNNTAITRVDFGEEEKTDRPAVVYLNRADFLPHTLIT
ncbi:MAG: histidine phosphatase family protein [Anaerolineae bacterium]|nr:histidine phosphatase family protein [Anaerolineae bacterium]